MFVGYQTNIIVSILMECVVIFSFFFLTYQHSFYFPKFQATACNVYIILQYTIIIAITSDEFCLY